MGITGCAESDGRSSKKERVIKTDKGSVRRSTPDPREDPEDERAEGAWCCCRSGRFFSSVSWSLRQGNERGRRKAPANQTRMLRGAAEGSNSNSDRVRDRDRETKV